MKKIVTILLCTLLVACSNEGTDTIPPTVLSKEKMAAVMVDIHLLEAAMSLNNLSGSIPSKVTITKDTATYKMEVFKKHGISKEQYKDSFYFYTQHPTFFTEVYQLILNDLSKMQAEVTNRK